ncbi:MAG: radical SAM family heme chaperone HemW [Anaeroplasmataceae bacterium]|nr:radical SAM family heme chaperone HemW [Anaeroplasmataceae bacterium]MDE6413872.1 radical SAM family heme chaperone HemW [Anaeroplasmataceae bacterium]
MNGIYIHIPFCNTICSYCDFPKQIAKEEVKESYLDYLLQELSSYEKKDWFKEVWSKRIESVYIGGGTPNSLALDQLERLFKALEPYLRNSIENTIEVNPELLTASQVLLFKKYNINRVSIGVQSFDPALIQSIRRNHTEEMVYEAVKLLKKEGISNINIDMMYGLPGQTMKKLKKDIKKVIGLKVPHISYYSLILEEKTILSYQMKHTQIVFPDDDLVVDMANYLTKKLKMRQFKHYEISNYAKKGYESIHNLGYWNCEEYIGIGASACGYYHNHRIQNDTTLHGYYAGKKIKTYISIKEQKQEYMMLGLRKLQGIHIKDYYEKFKSYPKDDFDLDYLYKNKLIEEKNDFIRIKQDKIWLGNLVFEAFVGGDEVEG